MFTVLLSLLLSSQAQAFGQLADVEIFDRKEGRTLPVYERDGRFYVAGEPGHEYLIRLRNGSHGRVLAVTSVDGVNVVSGETAAPHQTGYVLGAYEGMEILGWRKSMERTAAFFFTRHKNSYAARTGRPADVGVIGVAVFRERAPEPEPCCWPMRPYSGAAEDAAGSARSAQPEAASPPTVQRREEKLGTGHGRSEHSVVSYTDFERAGSQPDEIITIYYDSYRNLQAQGIIPSSRFYSERRPDAFPGRFVRDP
jgi:hypothetical protein